MDVKVSVVSCIIVITRITAPDAPYKDEQMKEIFQLILAAFENMSHVSTRSYKKVTSILDTIAKVKLCLVMLDLECDALVVEIFQSFLKMIRSNHSPAVFSNKETIMSLIINESEDISLDLLDSLFAILRKANQNVPSISWTVGEQIITRINTQLEKIMTPTQKLPSKLEGAHDVKVEVVERAFD
ncbi:sister chromatid cohesion protein PDS5 homolog D-like [Castanea sativa]|uniref:sister chromatid cohesion protein PDS5 homolog D-like n=1 Tax=Castanea sativa TaxID=21020 RepID=UPI003F64D55B